MKKFLLLATLLSASIASYADQLHNYNDVKSAVIAGKSVRIAIDFNKCTSPTGAGLANPKHNFSLGVYTPNEMIIDNQDQVVASLMHFTIRSQTTTKVPVYQFARYTITQNNVVVLTEQVLDAATYKPVTDEFTVNCPIDTAATLYS